MDVPAHPARAVFSYGRRMADVIFLIISKNFLTFFEKGLDFFEKVCYYSITIKVKMAFYARIAAPESNFGEKTTTFYRREL
jgi:hypothetical protein